MIKCLPEASPTDQATIAQLDKRKPYVWVATWFGAGFLRPAPGTWGTLGAVPFGVLMLVFSSPALLLISTLLATLLGLWAAAEFEKASGIHDSKMVVIDEVAGLWLTLLPISVLSSPSDPLYAAYIFAAFILFRFFDIIKPWPVSFFDQKIKGAIGVMADDLMAGLYAATLLGGIITYAGSS